MAVRMVLLVVFGALAFAIAWLLPRMDQTLDHFSVARSLIENNRGAEAVHLLEDGTWRGIAEYRARRFRRATTEFRQDESALSLYNLGTSFARLGEWGAARAAYEKTLRIAPDHADAAFNLSLVLQAEQRQQEEADNQRQTRTLGTEKGEPGETDREGEGEGQESADQDAQASDRAAPTDETPDRAGQSANQGRAADQAQFDEQAAGRGSLADGGDLDAADQQGTGAVLIRRESTQNAEIILRRIRDDPERVLRARLYAIHKNRQEAAR